MNLLFSKNSKINFTSKLKSSNISIFSRKKKIDLDLQGHFGLFFTHCTSQSNFKLTDISRNSGDICFLDDNAVNVMIASYPYRARYVCIRIKFNFYLPLAFIGLIRRLFIGAKRLNSNVEIFNILKIKLNKKNTYWLVIKNTNAMVPTQFSLSKEIGIKGLISFMNQNCDKYLVLRFFEKLPIIHREGGDLDIMVSDSSWEKTVNFFNKNPGEILVDMYGVTTPASGAMLPYYPPSLSYEMLENYIIGPGGARVPNDLNYLNSFIYHCIYHKGFSSGLASNQFESDFKIKPDNDYQNHILKLSKQANIDLPGLTLEELDSYMLSQNWRPHLDTLSFIANTNIWLKKYLKSLVLEEEVGLSVIILKQKAVDRDLSDLISDEIINNGFKILEYKIFNSKEKEVVFNSLRGGNWLAAVEGDLGFVPVIGILIIENSNSFLTLSSKGIKTNSIRALKNKLRKKFDDTDESVIHATDNTAQALEYVKVCFKDFQIENIDYKVELEKRGIGKLLQSYYVIEYQFKFFKIQFIDLIFNSVIKLFKL